MLSPWCQGNWQVMSVAKWHPGRARADAGEGMAANKNVLLPLWEVCLGGVSSWEQCPTPLSKGAQREAKPKKGTDAAFCCSVSQGRGERTGPRVGRLSFNYGWDVYQHRDFEQVPATLSLSFSMGNMSVITALISQGCGEDYIGEDLAQSLVCCRLWGNFGCCYCHIWLASQLRLVVITPNY